MHELYDASVKIDDSLNDPTNILMKFEYRMYNNYYLELNIEKFIFNFFNSKYRYTHFYYLYSI